MKKNLKKTLLTVALVALMTVCNAQIFLQKQKSDISPRATKTGGGQEWIIVPVQGVDIDQYAATPLGSGALLLAGLAGAYAFTKRKKK